MHDVALLVSVNVRSVLSSIRLVKNSMFALRPELISGARISDPVPVYVFVMLQVLES